MMTTRTRYLPTDLQVGGDMFAGLFCDTISTSTYRSGNGQAIDWMGEGWYRFTGAAGTRMYDVALDGPGVYSTPGRTACGPDVRPCSGKPMTLERGGHPSVEDGEVERIIGPFYGFSGNRKSRSSTARQATTCTTSQAQHSATRATAALARPSRTRTVLSRPSEAASFARYASRGTSRQGWRDSIRPDRDGRNGTPPPHIRFKERSEGVVLASRRPSFGVCLFLSLFSVPRQFSQRPSYPVSCERGGLGYLRFGPSLEVASERLGTTVILRQRPFRKPATVRRHLKPWGRLLGGTVRKQTRTFRLAATCRGTVLRHHKH